MQALKGSALYSLFTRLISIYRNSLLCRTVLYVVEAYRQSILGKCFKAVIGRESTIDYSIFIRIIKILFKKVDKVVMWLSEVLKKYRESCLIVVVSRFVVQIAKGKLFPLVFSVFGMGYLAGRVILNRLMIRDIFFLGLMFLVSAILMMDRAKRKAIIKNSLAYQLFSLVME